jgi:hypothetical protein
MIDHLPSKVKHAADALRRFREAPQKQADT